VGESKGNTFGDGRWRALSFSQPWLDYVLYGTKRIENRRWPTKFRGAFLLHAAQSFDRTAEHWARENGVYGDCGAGSVPPGMIAGVARVVDGILPSSVTAAEQVGRQGGRDLRWWMREQHGFVLADVVPLPVARRVPYRGSLNFWRVPAEVVESLGLPADPADWRPGGGG
jgi:hypothetical protein